MPRRLAAVVLAAAIAAPACGGEPPTPPSPSRPRATPAASSSASASAASSPAGPSPVATESTGPAVETSVQLPADAPRSVEGDVDVSDVPIEELAPPGASIGSSWSGSVATRSGHATTQALSFSWWRGDPMAPESGLEIWARFDATADASWRAVFAFTDRPRSGVLGVRFETGDVTRDHSPDLLSFESQGGSGACGVWRVISMNVEAYTELYRSQACDTDVRLIDGDLVLREAVFGPDDAHCCPSAYRTTAMRWTGERWAVVSRSTEPA